MQNTLSIRYAFCTCVRCYLEPSIVFKAKVAHHVRIEDIKLVDIILGHPGFEYFKTTRFI